MSFVPVTHVARINSMEENFRPYLFRHFAESGIRNLVLESSLMPACLKDPFLPEKLLKVAGETGITFVDGHAHFPDPLCPSYPIEEKRPFMLDYLKLEIRIAADFGVKTLTVHTGNNFDRSLPAGVYREAMYRSLDVLLPEAEKLDVILALENIWTVPNTGNELVLAMEKFPSKNLGLCYDSGHANIMKFARSENSPARIWWDSPEEIPQDDQILEKMLPYVVNCHLHDNHGLKDEHLLPGKGNIDWDHIMGLLKKAPRLQCIQNESSSFLATSAPAREVAELFEELCSKTGC